MKKILSELNKVSKSVNADYSKFEMKFDIEGANLADDLEGEISDMLKEVAKAVSQGRNSGNVKDTNGNTLGKWGMK